MLQGELFIYDCPGFKGVCEREVVGSSLKVGTSC
jgi:hypothetical protein